MAGRVLHCCYTIQTGRDTRIAHLHPHTQDLGSREEEQIEVVEWLPPPVLPEYDLVRIGCKFHYCYICLKDTPGIPRDSV